MARLTVMGDYQGPGERKTAETLAAGLPDDWHVIAGRKLSGPDRPDLDLLVVGERGIFLIEEKAWGPRVRLGDQYWHVRGDNRKNPLDRVNHLARALAGQLRDRVPGYVTAVGGRHRVLAGVILSYDEVMIEKGDTYADGDVVHRLTEAVVWLIGWDATLGTELSSVRSTVIDFLLGLPQRDTQLERIGPYLIQQELAPLGGARCFHAHYGDQTVILRCYPMHGWAPGTSPSAVIERERLAVNRLQERDRTWQMHPSFEDEARQWVVVPVVPPAYGKSLRTSLILGDPQRGSGGLPRQIAIDVVTDAFCALSEVREVGLIHRGLCPKRVFLARGLRVKFNDFHLARVTGAQTIAPQLSSDPDIGTPYRAPECRESISFAVPASDVYSLALCLACWLIGEDTDVPDPAAVRQRVAGFPVVGPVLADCLDNDPAARPDAATAVSRLRQAAEFFASTATASPAATSPFRVGGVIDGRYEVEKSLGQGGFARTWLARDVHTDAYRVIKEFHDDTAADFARKEYAAADVIRHDRCARVYDISRGQPTYLVLEYIPGQNLKEYAADHNPDGGHYRRIALDVLSGLAYLHGHNVLHRDITPGNVIVSDDGRAALIDFGVAGPLHSTTVVGTPPFVAPEILSRTGAGVHSDLYSFATAMIYAMLGRYPYAGDPAQASDRRDELVPPTDDERREWGQLGEALLKILFTAVEADPGGRPGSADELAAQLRTLDELPDTEGEERTNPVVNQLRGLYRASTLGNSGNRGLDDEFARETYVPTLLDTELMPAVLRRELRLVLLTGNPGDGKTSFLVQIGDKLTELGAEILVDDRAGWRRRLDGHTYVAVYDASESHQGASSDDLMRQALDPRAGEDSARRTVLLAINDGRLRQFFTDNEDLYDADAIEILRQAQGEAPQDSTIAVVDLKRRTLAPRLGGDSLGGVILDTFTSATRWALCDGCVSRRVCPIRQNAGALRGPARSAVEELITTSHLRRHRRATFRDVRSAFAWLVTGDLSCDDVHAARMEGRDLRRSGHALMEDLAFDATSADYLIQEWAELDPARTVAPDIERAARADRAFVVDPTSFTSRDRELAQRRQFFGLWCVGQGGRQAVRAYRYLDQFETSLRDDDADASRATILHRVLLGLSRLLGAPGYNGTALAVSDQRLDGAWAVLKEIAADEFKLERLWRPSRYVESRPDALRLSHRSGASLPLTLDTIELILRAADGELESDGATGSVRQEIESFAAALRRSPARAVRIVNPAGASRRAVVTGHRIQLEQA